ncbi:MAG: site-specific DNA-methyltransferase [Gammaproteobacteria bacterium]|nr:site-specific DNA-methyltransferase [Gammaproteobacteria bacterium]
MRNTYLASFPVELALRLVKLVDGPVAEPFTDSGTVRIAAGDLGIPYVLNDSSPNYRSMFFERNITTNNKQLCGGKDLMARDITIL